MRYQLNSKEAKWFSSQCVTKYFKLVTNIYPRLVRLLDSLTINVSERNQLVTFLKQIDVCQEKTASKITIVGCV